MSLYHKFTVDWIHHKIQKLNFLDLMLHNTKACFCKLGISV